jgi:hypothetical protein
MGRGTKRGEMQNQMDATGAAVLRKRWPASDSLERSDSTKKNETRIHVSKTQFNFTEANVPKFQKKHRHRRRMFEMFSHSKPEAQHDASETHHIKLNHKPQINEVI